MEFIQTIQGEGINVGKPVILVRFDGCNLCCGFCDTKCASLSKEKTSYEVISNQINDLRNKYPNIDTLLITGGEPIYDENIKMVTDILATQSNMNFEIETNGTSLGSLFWNMRNKCDLDEIQLNISPKFNVDAHKNIESLENIESIEEIYSIYKDQFLIMKFEKFNNYTVKFVYGDYLNNCDNIILSFIIMNNIPKEKVCVMPFTPNQNNFDHPRNFLDAFNDSAKQSIEFCLKHGFRYSPREHITLNIK